MGSGCGLDGLDIARIIEIWQRYTTNKTKEYKIINVDINEHWLKMNKFLANKILADDSAVQQKNISALAYLTNRDYLQDIHNSEVTIICCNGFAEFLDLKNLHILFSGLQELLQSLKGKFMLLVPFALKNIKQEYVSKLVGFNYTAKARKEIIHIIYQYFPNWQIDSKENYSQIIFRITNY